MNKQLETKKIKVGKGQGIVDASITESPFSSKGKTTYEIAEDRKEDDRAEEDKEKEDHQAKLIKKTKPGVDSEGRYLKKARSYILDTKSMY